MYAEADTALIKAGKVPSDAEEQAWLIFRFFICPNSPFECGMNPHRRKDIMHNLAHPTKDMFSSLENSVHRLIRNQYANFSFTREFSSLPRVIIANKHEQLEEKSKQSKTHQKSDIRDPNRDSKKYNDLHASCLGFRSYGN